MSQRDKSVDALTIGIFWRANKMYKKDLLLAGLQPLQVLCLSTLLPLYIGKTLAALGARDPHAGKYLPIMIGIVIIGLIFNRISFGRFMDLQAKTLHDLQQKIIAKLLDRSVGFHNNNVSGKLVADATDYLQSYSQLTSTLFISIQPFVVAIATGITVVLIRSWELGLMLIGMTFVVVGSAYWQSRRRAPLRAERHEARRAVTGHMADTIVNSQTVKTFARESAELKQHQKLSKLLLKLRQRDWHTVTVDGSRRMSALLIFELGFIAYIVHIVTKDPSLLAIGIFSFTYVVSLTGRLFEVNNMIRTIEESFVQAEPMTKIILEDSEVKDSPDAKPVQVERGAIDLKEVNFTYQDNTSNKKVFSELTLHIKPGERVGLVGPSGGGKSTLTRLLLRFEDVQGGSISVDDQNISLVTQTSLRENISYVPQEPLLFHRSVRENIAYGKPRASQAQIEEAAKRANAHEFIDELPDGYDTVVGERGVKLSGGQRQRVAIARAILKNAPILVLDEATSALDSENEQLIQQALWNLMNGKTALVIAHRLSTVQKLDRIIVMDGGHIVEEGTHNELTVQKGIYASLWARQSGGFIDE